MLAREAVSVSGFLLVVSARRIHGRSQSWNAGAEAQPLISCFEMLARLLLALATADFWAHHFAAELRQRLRRRSHDGVHNSTSPASLRSGICKMGHVFPRSTTSQESTTSGPTHSAATRTRSEGSSRLLSVLNFASMTCSAPVINRDESPSTKDGQPSSASWTAKTRRRWLPTAFNALSFLVSCRVIMVPRVGQSLTMQCRQTPTNTRPSSRDSPGASAAMPKFSRWFESNRLKFFSCKNSRLQCEMLSPSHSCVETPNPHTWVIFSVWERSMQRCVSSKTKSFPLPTWQIANRSASCFCLCVASHITQLCVPTWDVARTASLS